MGVSKATPKSEPTWQARPRQGCGTPQVVESAGWPLHLPTRAWERDAQYSLGPLRAARVRSLEAPHRPLSNPERRPGVGLGRHRVSAEGQEPPGWQVGGACTAGDPWELLHGCDFTQGMTSSPTQTPAHALLGQSRTAQPPLSCSPVPFSFALRAVPVLKGSIRP